MIGVFDSGVGGLTVVKEIFRHLPQYQIVYFGDTARLPYGTKGADFVKRYSKKITEWLLRKGAKIIVVACNTSSAWAADYLKKEFPSIPIFEMIDPAVLAVLPVKDQGIGVIGTPGTIKSGAYDRKLKAVNSKIKIVSKPCPLFVPMIEEGIIDGQIAEDITKLYCEAFKNKKISSLILACTHYPLLEKTISKTMGKNIGIINPAASLAKSLKEFLKNNPNIEKNIKKGIDHRFFFSDEPYNLQKIGHLCFKKKIQPIIGDPF